MTRGVIGVVLLLVLLAGGMFLQWTMDTIHAPIARELAQAAETGAREQWDAALQHQENAARLWQKSWHLTAAFADHLPMEDIDSLFSELPVYYTQKEQAHYVAVCRELARRIEAMSDAHRLTWWNLL